MLYAIVRVGNIDIKGIFSQMMYLKLQMKMMRTKVLKTIQTLSSPIHYDETRSVSKICHNNLKINPGMLIHQSIKSYSEPELIVLINLNGKVPSRIRIIRNKYVNLVNIPY